MKAWQVQDAKARFSEFLDATLEKGPQIVTRRGIETAVLVAMDEWKRLQDSVRPSVKSLLLADEGRSQNLVPKRRRWTRRPVPKFE